MGSVDSPVSRTRSQSIERMTLANIFLDALHERRSRYDLEKRSPIPDTRIQQIIREAILHVPSAYNSQSTRIVLLLEEEHDKLWEITKTVLKAIVPDGAYPITEKKLNGFKAAYSTVSHLLCILLLHPLVDWSSKRSSSSTIVTSSRACRRNSRISLTNSRTGLPSQMPCINMLSGSRSNLKA